MTNLYQKRLGKALRQVRLSLGYPSVCSAFSAQNHLTYDQLVNRELGRAAISLEDLIKLADDWGSSPGELFCLLSEAMEESTFTPLAIKFGLTVDEARKRFQSKQAQTGIQFEQLYLLVLKDQIQI